jgi:DNA-binding NarL/FixJ family response regulator
MKPIRLLLADDHTLFRAGIRLLLKDSADIKIVAEASTGREAVQLSKTTHPDVVLMDITMKNLSGLEATAYIVQEDPRVRVLMLSMHDNEQYVIQALRIGARGYLLKDATPTELEDAIKAVARGEAYLSQAVAKYVVADYRRRGCGKAEDEPSRAAALTPRQREILHLITEGQATKEIAARLYLSENTIETHRRQLLKRLGVRRVADLIRVAIRLGLVPSDR